MKQHACVLCGTSNSELIFRKAGYDLEKCRSCGLLYVGNPPTDAKLKEIYSFASNYHLGFRDDESHRQEYLQWASRCFEFVRPIGRPGRVLDIGCSAGFFLHVAKENGWQTTGLELSEDTATLARERFGLDVTTGSIEHVKFAPQSFDLITLWDVLEHVRNPLATLRAVHPLLKSGGHVAISTPNSGGLYPTVSGWLRNVLGYWEHPEPPYHLFQFSADTLRQTLERADFEVVKLHHRWQRLSHTFGTFGTVMKSPKRMLYAAAFMPAAVVGPSVSSGDWMIAIARKR